MPQRALELLSGMAVALGHDVDVDFLLAELAAGVRATLDADRVSVLLLDDADRLSPTVAVGRRQDDALWQRFRRMPPIALDDLPGARRALAGRKVLVIDDAAASPLVPAAWQRAFELGSLAIAPLAVGEVPVGLVAVEYAEPGAAFTATQLALLEGMAALAGIALRGGRERTQAQRVAGLSALVQALAGVRTRRAVAEQALAGLLETARVSHGLFALVAPVAVEVLAVRGPRLPEPGRYPLAELPAELVATCHSAWALDPRALVAVEIGGSALTVVPVAGPRGPVAVAVLPVAVTSLPFDVTVDLQLAADATALALDAVRLAGDRDWHRRAATTVSAATAALARDGGVVAVVDELRALLADAGADSPRVVVDRPTARATGLSAATATVARLLTRWRRTDTVDGPVRLGQEIAVALRADGRVVGALVWRAGPVAPVEARTQLIATLLGDLLGRAAAHQRSTELERIAADAAAHRAVAARAYRESGQILQLASDQLRGSQPNEPRVAAARALNDQARHLVRDAAEALAPSVARQPGLRAALAAATKQIFATGGPETLVRQTGRVPVLDPASQVALLRATTRVLALLRQARAAAAVVHVSGHEREVVVAVRAEEMLKAAQLEGPGLLAALRDARGWLSPVGGSIEILRGDPAHQFVMRAPAGVSRPGRVDPPPSPDQDIGEVVVPFDATRPTSP